MVRTQTNCRAKICGKNVKTNHHERTNTRRRHPQQFVTVQVRPLAVPDFIEPRSPLGAVGALRNPHRWSLRIRHCCTVSVQQEECGKWQGWEVAERFKRLCNVVGRAHQITNRPREKRTNRLTSTAQLLLWRDFSPAGPELAAAATPTP